MNVVFFNISPKKLSCPTRFAGYRIEPILLTRGLIDVTHPVVGTAGGRRHGTRDTLVVAKDGGTRPRGLAGDAIIPIFGLSVFVPKFLPFRELLLRRAPFRVRVVLRPRRVVRHHRVRVRVVAGVVRVGRVTVGALG